MRERFLHSVPEQTLDKPHTPESIETFFRRAIASGVDKRIEARIKIDTRLYDREVAQKVMDKWLNQKNLTFEYIDRDEATYAQLGREHGMSGNTVRDSIRQCMTSLWQQCDLEVQELYTLGEITRGKVNITPAWRESISGSFSGPKMRGRSGKINNAARQLFDLRRRQESQKTR